MMTGLLPNVVLGWVFLSLCSGSSALAETRTDQWFFGKDSIAPEIQINYRFLGHTGSALVQNTPPGGFYIEGQYGWWLNHFVQGHLLLGHSVSGDPAWFMGVGGRLNLLEFSKANALEYATDSRTGMRCVETKRGLLSLVFRSLVMHLDLEFVQHFFTPTNPSSPYPTSVRALQYGGGVQWGPNIAIDGISRLYVDTTIQFSRLLGIFYIVPYAGIGINF